MVAAKPAAKGAAAAKPAAAKGKPAAKGKTAAPAVQKESLFTSKPRQFGIGGAIQPKRDLSRFTRWPAYVRLQRQRRVLYSRLKVPPAIAQFSKTLDKNSTVQLFKVLDSMRPEDRKAKKARLRAAAEAKAKGVTVERGPKPIVVKYGINHICSLVESKKAKLVCISADVDPIEIVLWLPALCHRMNVPYCIVKGGRSRLGMVCRKKSASAVAITAVPKERQADFANLIIACKDAFNNQYETAKRTWGGSSPSNKSIVKEARKLGGKQTRAAAADA